MNPTIPKLRNKLRNTRKAAESLLNGVAAEPETRDLSPEESAKFDSLMADVKTIKGQLDQLASLESEEDAMDEDPEPEPRSVPQRRSRPIGEAPAVHTETRRYSILKAIRTAVEGRPQDGLEGELSSEVARRAGKSPKGFFLPLGTDPEVRAMMAGARPERRADFTTTTGAGALFTIAELPLIDLLRAKLVVRQLGATILTGLKGAIAIPRQTGSVTVYWLGEGTSATPSAPSVDQVPLSPKVAIALTNISRKFLLQSSIDAEDFVKSDIAATMAREWDRVCLNGAGTNQPLGILQNTAVTSLSSGIQGGTNGAAITYAQTIAMETLVSVANADTEALAYLTNPTQRGKLKQAPLIGSTYPTFVWSKGDRAGVGEVNGYPAYATTAMPNSLSKGTGSNLSAVIFGNWSDLVVGSWDDAVDFLVNPYTNQASGTVTISMEMAMDVAVRHNESFAVVTDAI